MLPKWMDAAVDLRTDELMEKMFFQEKDDLFKKCMEKLKQVDSACAFEIETIFYSRTRQAFHQGYKFGMRDMRDLIK